MITLDDTIAIRHLIVCRICCISGRHKEDGLFTNMNDWLNHKHFTSHKKDSHTVAIVGGAMRVGEEPTFEYIHTFNPVI